MDEGRGRRVGPFQDVDRWMKRGAVGGGQGGEGDREKRTAGQKKRTATHKGRDKRRRNGRCRPTGKFQGHKDGVTADGSADGSTCKDEGEE